MRRSKRNFGLLFPSTVLKSRHTKYALYQPQGIKYYLIADPDSREVEVYQLEDATYLLNQKGNDFTFEFLLEDCKALVNFKEIW